MTTILPTVGPITSKETDLKFILNISKSIRLNGSHNTLQWHRDISKKIKKINKNSSILLDIPGVKPRTNNLIPIEINQGDKIVFYYKKKPNLKDYKIFIELTNPLPLITKIKKFSINDGELYFDYIQYKENYLIGKSKSKYTLKIKKGLNIPYSIYNNKIQEKKMLNFIKKAKKIGIKFDGVGVSFVQNQNILLKIKKKYPSLLIISKIENFEGFKNAENIIKISDCVMIDRGDLAAEIEDKNLYNSILKIVEITKKYSKNLIIATDNLSSMITRSIPTKSEIFSIGYAQNILADQIMLSDETATSHYWKRTLIWLNNHLKVDKIRKDITNYDFWSDVNSVNTEKIILFSKKGYALDKMKIDNNKEYFIFSENDKIRHFSNFKSNIRFFNVSFGKKSITNDYIFKNIKLYKDYIFKDNKPALLVHILFPRKDSRANSMSILYKKDF